MFQDLLQNNLIRNCPITYEDAKRALHIYGPDIATLKGKTVKRQNKGIPTYQPIMMPAPIIQQYKNLRLFIDIFSLTAPRSFTPSPNGLNSAR
jgi:hypothetical protein